MQGPTTGPVAERERLLAERYGAPRPGARGLVIAAVVVVAALFGGWLAWTTWVHATPDVTSQLVGYDVVDTHSATGTLDVALGEGVEADAVRCTLRAFSPDHAIVGELVFAPGGSGLQTLTVRTAREATSVELLGCTTADQQRPR